MSYVDLNPVRAGINPTPASSDYTSIQARIQTYQSPTPEHHQDSSQTTQTLVKLIDFIGHEHKNQPEGIAFSFSDYMELVDWTGQVVRDDKTGAIAESLAPILSRLGIEQDGAFPGQPFAKHRIIINQGLQYFPLFVVGDGLKYSIRLRDVVAQGRSSMILN